jgi:hypothetical protein
MPPPKIYLFFVVMYRSKWVYHDLLLKKSLFYQFEMLLLCKMAYIILYVLLCKIYGLYYFVGTQTEINNKQASEDDR